MTGRELVLLFKKDSGMNEMEWERFCRRYVNKDISSVIDTVKVLYEGAEFSIPSTFKEALKEEIQKTLSRSTKKITVAKGKELVEA